MRKFFIPIFLIALSVLVFFVLINPQYEGIKEVKEEGSRYDEALSKSRELQQTRDDLLARYNSFNKEDVDRLEKLLPNNVDSVRLIIEIAEIASKYGMYIKEIDLPESSKSDSEESISDRDAKGYETMELGFTISSSYKDFTSFIHDLESSLRLVDIEEISFSSSIADFYEYDVKFRTYWLANE